MVRLQSIVQGNGHTEDHLEERQRVPSSTQTESPTSQLGGKLSSMDFSGLSFTAPASPVSYPAAAAAVQTSLYKEPSFAVTSCPDVHHSAQPEASRASEPIPASSQQADGQQHGQPGRASTEAQTEALAIPGKGRRTEDHSRRSSIEQPSSWTMAGTPAPASPFAMANDDEEDFTFSGSRASQGAEAPAHPPASASSPTTSPSGNSLFALRQKESSASQQDRRQESPAPSSASGHGRRSLESADSAYTAMHAARQQNLADWSAATAAAHPEAANGTEHVPASDCTPDLTGAYSAASSMPMSPVIGDTVRKTFSLWAAMPLGHFLAPSYHARSSR